MSKRRTNAEIAEVEAIALVTFQAARSIEEQVNATVADDDERSSNYVSVAGGRYYSVRADSQKSQAKVFEVHYETKNAEQALRVALAIRRELHSINAELKAKLVTILVDEIDGGIETAGTDTQLTGIILKLERIKAPSVDDAITLVHEAEDEIEEGTQLARVYDKFIALKVRS